MDEAWRTGNFPFQCHVTAGSQPQPSFITSSCINSKGTCIKAPRVYSIVPPECFSSTSPSNKDWFCLLVRSPATNLSWAVGAPSPAHIVVDFTRSEALVALAKVTAHAQRKEKRSETCVHEEALAPPVRNNTAHVLSALQTTFSQLCCCICVAIDLQLPGRLLLPHLLRSSSCAASILAAVLMSCIMNMACHVAQARFMP